MGDRDPHNQPSPAASQEHRSRRLGWEQGQDLMPALQYGMWQPKQRLSPLFLVQFLKPPWLQSYVIIAYVSVSCFL